ncbi:hypothetical protein K501DRAFT_315055 [Backusella circina FSU 941]|nr:hypothetical protein K501DRAFT_315055 [Backusella circina FSU 941]
MKSSKKLQQSSSVLLYKFPGTTLQKHGIKTSSKYASFSDHLLREAVQVDEAFLGEEEEEETDADVDDDEYENENDEVETDKNNSRVKEEHMGSVEEDIVGDSNENSSIEEDVEGYLLRNS